MLIFIILSIRRGQEGQKIRQNIILAALIFIYLSEYSFQKNYTKYQPKRYAVTR